MFYRSPPRRGEQKYQRDFKRIYILVISLYLAWTLYNADKNLHDYYKTLGVPVNASEKELRSNYRELSLRYHPDKVSESGENVEAIYLNIRDAYEVLKSPIKRQIYGIISLTKTRSA
jgi:preprotein translocase subunit Sec63